MKKEKILRLRLIVIDVILLIILVLIDQYTKYLAVINFKNQPAFSIISGVLEFNYLENKGAAFGLLQNQKVFFVFVAVILLLVIAYVIYKLPLKKKYNKLHFLLVMVSAGAIGNMIDRVRLDYVVDFIYFVFINFPIFNVADMYVTISVSILAFLVLFIYKEEDFEFLSFKQKKYREIK